MANEVRRIVTSNVNGRSVISADGMAPAVYDLGGGMSVIDLWRARLTPTDLGAPDEAAQAGPLSLAPPPAGNVLRIADFPPESAQGTSADDAKAMFEKMGAGDALNVHGDERTALVHRTDTLDYGIVLEGEITMLVDDGEVLLRAGDVVIQRGTNHGWVNRSGRYCRMAFVLIDGTRSPS